MPSPRKKITSPRGVAIYPKLNSPDTKFNTEGEYGCKLRIKGADAAELLTFFDAMLNETLAFYRATGELKGEPKELSVPIKEHTEDDGTPTGDYVLSAKLKAVGRNKAGETWKNQPELYDRNGGVIDPAGPQIGSGSTIAMAGECYGWLFAGKVGVTMRLSAAVVFDLVEMQGGSAESYGFELDPEPDAETIIEQGGEASDKKPDF